MTFRIVFLPFDGFSNMVLASAIEPLRAACDLSGRPLFNWCVATPGGEAVSSSSGLRLAAEIELSEIGQCDALVLIAGYGAREAAARPELLPAIRAAARRSRTVTGLDMGAWIMAAAGLLEGYRATVHWHEMEAFAEEFAGVEAVAESYVTDGDRQSAGSATSAMELTLEAIRWLGGMLWHTTCVRFSYTTISSAVAPRAARCPRSWVVPCASCSMQSRSRAAWSKSRLMRRSHCARSTGSVGVNWAPQRACITALCV